MGTTAASLFEDFIGEDDESLSVELEEIESISEIYTDLYCIEHGIPTTKDWVLFILKCTELISGKTWYRYQKIIAARIIEAVILHETDTITALLSRQSGKSQILADIAPGLTLFLPQIANSFEDDERFSQFKDGFKIGIFAPTMRAALLIYAKIRLNIENSRYSDALKEFGLSMSPRAEGFDLSNKSLCKAITASPDSKVEGETFHLIILEEAQLLTRWKIVKEIMPMAAATAGVVVAIGTSLKRCYFFDRIKENEKAFKEGEGKQNHFQYTYLDVIKHRREVYAKTKDRYHINYESYVKGRMMELGGEDSEEFKMNFLLMWSEDGLAAIPLDTLEYMKEHHEEVYLPYADYTCVASLDVAKGVYDASVLTIKAVDFDNPIVTETVDPMSESGSAFIYRFRKKTIFIHELGGKFEGDEGQYKKVVDILMQVPTLKMFIVDASGLASAVAERFECLLPGIKVVPFTFNLQSKSELYQVYLTSWRQKWESVVYGPIHRTQLEIKKFYSQHTNLEKFYKRGFMVCEAPDGEHDDYPDSSALCTWGIDKLLYNHVNGVSADTITPTVEDADIGVLAASQEMSAYEAANRRIFGGRV